MAARTDWLDFAHKLDKEREAIHDALPAGVDVTITLSAYGGGGASFMVSLSHAELRLDGWGSGRTPAKALEAAKADMKKKADEQRRRPRLVGPRALPGMDEP